MPRGMITVVAFQTIAVMVLRRLVAVAGLGPSRDAKDVELAVLRHQLAVLHRLWGANTPSLRLTCDVLSRRRCHVVPAPAITEGPGHHRMEYGGLPRVRERSTQGPRPAANPTGRESRTVSTARADPVRHSQAAAKPVMAMISL
jgi:hypothetical protein